MVENIWELKDRELIRVLLGNIEKLTDIAKGAEREWEQGTLMDAISSIERDCHTIKLSIFPGGGFTFPE